ncbi:metallo-hydrolase/oxidoreductase [Salinisphaera sp. C84B14]|uniref:quinoprotein relay system zinc metallohydrolase 2 n=1 Tax=Salinisphaera sp. C84B14 TaxID=1304155 RepID=UPI00333E59F5
MLASTAAATAQTRPAFEVDRIADGVFVHSGLQAEADDRNHGDIANLGFVIGADCVAVIDTGGSPYVGRALRRAIEVRTSTPVCYVINTHMHPDHVFGNAAFADTDARYIAAAGFAHALAARRTTYLKRAERTLGVAVSDGWIVMPDDVVDSRMRLDLGGRSLQLTAWADAHTDNDLTVFDEASHTLFTGDLLFVDRVPAIDASLSGWLDVTASLDALAREVAHVVPGHGPAGQGLDAMLAPQTHYLEAIRDQVQSAIDDGYGLAYTTRHVARGERDRWLLFDDYHVRNVTAAYTELEWQ